MLGIRLAMQRQQMWDSIVGVKGISHQRMTVARLRDGARHADDPEGWVVQRFATPGNRVKVVDLGLRNIVGSRRPRHYRPLSC